MIPQIPIFRKELENGLRVIVAPERRLPILSQYTFYRVGSRNESSGITGISHLFEHMMFNGSQKFGPGEFDRILESHGGHSNAYTTHDITVYYESFPPDILALAMELNSDRMGWLNLNSENLESEREVVKEERRMRTDNYIPGILEELLHATAFTAHPYRWPIIGWMSDIDRITLEECREYHDAYYSPNNAVLMISGDCDPEEVFSLSKKYYGSIQPRKVPQGRITEEPEQQGERRAIHYKKTQMESCMFGYHVPGANDRVAFALDILQVILGVGESSRLYHKIVYEKETGVDIDAVYEWRFDPTLFVFYCQLSQGKITWEAEELVKNELKDILLNGVSHQELEKAKTILSSSLIRGLKTASGRANKLGTVELFFGDCGELTRLPEKYDLVTGRDVQETVERFFNDKHCTVVSVLPEQ